MGEIMKIKIRKMSTRFTLRIMAVIAIIIIIVGILMSYLFSKKIMEETISLTEHKLKIVASDLDDNLREIKELFKKIRDNETIQELMEREDFDEDQNQERLNEISRILREYSYGEIWINSIFAYGNNLKIYDPLYQITPYNEIANNYDEFHKFINSDEFERYSSPSAFPNKKESVNENDLTTITYFSKYLSNNNFEKLGYLLINIKKDFLFHDMIKFVSDEFDTTYILDEQGDIVFKTGNLELKDDFKIDLKDDNKFVEKRNIKGKKYLIFKEVLRENKKWSVVCLIRYGRVNQELLMIRNLVLLIGLVSIILAMFITDKFTRTILGPVLKINGAMNTFKNGEWPKKLEVETDDEMKNLTENFNEMVERFKELLEKVYIEQEEKKKAEIKSIEFKLQLLQSQINPHFVHNTLNAIQYMALKEEAYEIREMIQSFNMLLRSSMSVEKEFITIEEELECVKSFLKIQEIRYGDVVNLICDIDNKIMDFEIPKLILQPIVENSLFHGIVPKRNKGTIIIKMKDIGEYINIKIIDDGVGMSEDKLKNILITNENLTRRGYNNIGLSNINDRLKLNYGEKYSLIISSDFGLGTTIEFNIPNDKK